MSPLLALAKVIVGLHGVKLRPNKFVLHVHCLDLVDTWWPTPSRKPSSNFMTIQAGHLLKLSRSWLCPQDQSERCLDLGIDTVVWNSGTREDQKSSIEKELRGGEPSIKLLYTTPESLRTPRLAAALQVKNL